MLDDSVNHWIQQETFFALGLQKKIWLADNNAG